MRTLIIIALSILLSGCVPALQSVHDEVWPKHDYVRGLPKPEWSDSGRFRGNCAAFASVVWTRAMARGMDAEIMVVWRNEGDVLTGYEVKWHAVVISDGYVSDNNYRWVYPEHEFWERWNDGTH